MIEVNTIIRITELEYIVAQLEFQCKSAEGEEKEKIMAQLENFWHELDTLQEFGEGRKPSQSSINIDKGLNLS